MGVHLGLGTWFRTPTDLPRETWRLSTLCDSGTLGGPPPDVALTDSKALAEEVGRAVAAALAWSRQEEHQPARRDWSGLAPGTPPVTIVLRPLASGLPIGFFAMVLAATLLGAQAVGLLPSTASAAIGLVLVPTAIDQLVGGVSAILSRDVIAATIMMTFSGVWFGTALVYALHPAHGLEVLAVWYLALCPVIVCLLASASGKLALSLVPMVGLPTFLATGIWLLAGGRTLGVVVGCLSFLLAVVGLYAAVALLMEDARRRTVLPTVRRGAMRTALTGDLQAQLRDIEHEAGVRRYL